MEKLLFKQFQQFKPFNPSRLESRNPFQTGLSLLNYFILSHSISPYCAALAACETRLMLKSNRLR
jgi:hypothetical protein